MGSHHPRLQQQRACSSAPSSFNDLNQCPIGEHKNARESAWRQVLALWDSAEVTPSCQHSIYCGFMAPPPAERHDKQQTEEGRMETFAEPSTQDGLCLQEKHATGASCQAPILRGGLHLTAGTLTAASMEFQRESIAEIGSPLN